LLPLQMLEFPQFFGRFDARKFSLSM